MSAGGRAANGAAAPSDDRITTGSSAGSAAAISVHASMPDDSCRSVARFFGDLSPAHYQVNLRGSLLLLLLACLSEALAFIGLRALLCSINSLPFCNLLPIQAPHFSSSSMLI
jgi:hypothetical protein